jgi:hypothetical protein
MKKIKNILLTIIYQEIVLLIVFTAILLLSRQNDVDILSLAVSGIITVTISILLNEFFESTAFGPLAATATLFIISYVESGRDFAKIQSDSDKGSLVMGVIILYFILYIIAVCSKNTIERLSKDKVTTIDEDKMIQKLQNINETKISGFQPEGNSDEIPKPSSFKEKRKQKDEFNTEEEL